MTRFVVTVRGEAGPTVRAALENFDVAVGENITVLRCDLVDNAALYGLMQQLQDLGIEIMEVKRDEQCNEPTRER
jgi:hypothetical protein